MAQRTEVPAVMAAARGQRHNMIDIGGRAAATAAQWFLSQNQNPQPPPGGTVSALVRGWPVVWGPGLNPFTRTGGPVLRYLFAHALILSKRNPPGNRNQGVEGGPPGRRPSAARPGGGVLHAPALSVIFSPQHPYKTHARAFCFCNTVLLFLPHSTESSEFLHRVRDSTTRF